MKFCIVCHYIIFMQESYLRGSSYLSAIDAGTQAKLY